MSRAYPRVQKCLWGRLLRRGWSGGISVLVDESVAPGRFHHSGMAGIGVEGRQCLRVPRTHRSRSEGARPTRGASATPGFGGMVGGGHALPRLSGRRTRPIFRHPHGCLGGVSAPSRRALWADPSCSEPSHCRPHICAAIEWVGDTIWRGCGRLIWAVRWASVGVGPTGAWVAALPESRFVGFRSHSRWPARFRSCRWSPATLRWATSPVRPGGAASRRQSRHPPRIRAVAVDRRWVCHRCRTECG